MYARFSGSEKPRLPQFATASPSGYYSLTRGNLSNSRIMPGGTGGLYGYGGGVEVGESSRGGGGGFVGFGVPMVMGATSRSMREGDVMRGDYPMAAIMQTAPQGPSRMMVPGQHLQTGPQFSSMLPAVTNPWGPESISNSNARHGFPYGNFSVPNSATNMGMVGFPSGIPSTSTTFTPQLESMPAVITNNFYTRPVFINGRPNVEGTRNQKGCTCCNLFSCNMIRSRDCNAHRAHQNSRQPTKRSSQEELDDELKETNLKLILRKELSNSDVGSVGRIVLPKKEAEANLPPLDDKEGITLEMNDLTLPITWKFKYRFWPNNRSRMYIMETTGEFVRTHGLQTGDLFIIYRSSESDRYVVRAKKGVQPPPAVEVVHCDCRHQCNMNANCQWQPLRSGIERGENSQLGLQQGNILQHSSNLAIADGAHPSMMGFSNGAGGQQHIGFPHFSQPGIVPENIPFGGALP